MGIILVVILVIVLIGALPTWRHSKSWGPYPSGGIGLILLILVILLLLGRIWGGFDAHELVLITNDIETSRDFKPSWFTWRGYKKGLLKGIDPHHSPWIGEISVHTELRQEARCHAFRYVGTACGCSNRGDIDSPCPEAIELYRCSLSHYNRHSRVGPLIALRILYC